MAHSVLGNNNSYDTSITLLEKVISSDDPYHFAGHYYLAYAYLRKNFGGKGKNVPELSTGAHRHLSIAKVYLEEVIIAQLQAMQLVLGTKSTGTPLATQISNKIELLNHQLNYINNALEFIERNNDGKKILTAGSTTKTFDQFYPPENVPTSEIRELNRLGSLNLFTIDAKNPPQDVLSSVVVTLIGVGQVVFGVMTAIATGGQRGVGLIVGGLQDVYQGASSALKGEGIDLGGYFKAKAIEIGIALISDRIVDKFTGSSKLIEKGVTQPVRNLTTKQVLKEVGIRVGTRLASDQLIKVTVKKLSKTILKKAIGGEIKDAVATIKARLSRPQISQALENIYAIDTLYQGRFGRELSRRLAEFLNKRSSELQTIATAVISSTLSKAAEKSGSTTGAVILNTASTGVNVAIALDKIKELADDFCDYMEETILQTENSLPENKDIIKRLVPSINDEEAVAIEKYLHSSSIIKGKWDIDGNLLGFREGIAQLTEVKEDKKEPEIFKFEEIENILHSKDKNNTQEIETRTLDEINLEKLGLILKTTQIQRAIKQMHSAFASRGQFSAPIIDSYCDIIASRMHGQIRSAIVSPIVSTISKPIFESIEQKIVNNVVYYHENLEKQFLSEDYKRNAELMISGVSAGDEDPERKIKIYNDEEEVLIDARGDEDIPKLVSINKLEENREFNRMLRSIQDYQQEGKQVPIFDVSNKTTIIPKANTGFSFVNSAHANPMGSVATTMGGGIVGQDLALAIAFRTSTFLSKAPIAMGIVGTGMGLHNAAQFEAQHPLLSFEFNDIMTNPYISQKDKDSYWQKATNDPLFITRSNSVINMPVTQTELSELLKDVRMDIDPNAGKTIILVTPPIHYPIPLIYTPDESDEILQRGQLPGFIPTPIDPSKLLESFLIHEQDWKDLILYKDYLDTVDKINGRYPINGDLAGKQYPLSEDLQKLYPEGVLFKENGCPDFTPYANITVEVEELTGNHYRDFQKANKAAGLDKTPLGKTWHHVEDEKTMQLVPEDLHYQVKHTGGSALLKNKGK